MAASEQRIAHIFRTCYELLDKYRNGIDDQDWEEIHNYHKGRLDSKDKLAVDMYTVCVKELYEQYKMQKY